MENIAKETKEKYGLTDDQIQQLKDERTVRVIATISLHRTCLFLILELAIMVVLFPFGILIPELGLMSDNTYEMTMLTAFIVMNLALIIILVKHGRKEYEETLALTPDDIIIGVISERRLELAVLIISVLSILWCLLIGLELNALCVFLTVIEGFAFLFLLMFISIRFLIVRKIRSLGMIALVLAGISLWCFIVVWSA